MAVLDVTLYAHNDFNPTVEVSWLTTNKQTKRPYENTDGPAPQIFLASTDDPDVAIGDPEAPADLECSVTYIGVGGLWLPFLDATVVTTALCDPLFLALGTAYMHIRNPDTGSRQVRTIGYARLRPAA